MLKVRLQRQQKDVIATQYRIDEIQERPAVRRRDLQAKVVSWLTDKRSPANVPATYGAMGQPAATNRPACSSRTSYTCQAAGMGSWQDLRGTANPRAALDGRASWARLQRSTMEPRSAAAMGQEFTYTLKTLCYIESDTAQTYMRARRKSLTS